MLQEITPVILTFNEERNIGRTLSRLTWASDIVVVDSYSTDKTLDVVRGFPQARIFQRAFDSHAEQWNFAAFETGVKGDWILALDADYLLSPELIGEMRRLCISAPIEAYRATFKYCVLGKTLRAALYPPVAVLFRKKQARFHQDGHTHRLAVAGAIAPLVHPILHDDRKPLAQWLASQDRYMRLEAENISKKRWSDLNWADRLRRVPPLAVFAVFIYCYVLKGGVLDGKAGLFYATQRMLAEALLALHLIDREK